jgi:hypothetical protein
MQLRKVTLPQRLTLGLRKAAIQRLERQLANLLETHAETIGANRSHLAAEAQMKASMLTSMEERTRLEAALAARDIDLENARSQLTSLQSQLVCFPSLKKHCLDRTQEEHQALHYCASALCLSSLAHVCL